MIKFILDEHDWDIYLRLVEAYYEAAASAGNELTMLDDPDFMPDDLPKGWGMEADPNSIPMPNGLPKGCCMVADVTGANALFRSRLQELREAERLDDRQKKLLEGRKNQFSLNRKHI